MNDRPAAFLPPHPDDLDAFERLVAGLEDGFNRKAPEILDDRFCTDATLVAPDGTIVRGHADLIEYHTARLAGAAASWTTRFSILGVNRLDETTAVIHTRQEMTTPERSFTHHGTILAIKREGGWWIAAMQNTTVRD